MLIHTAPRLIAVLLAAGRGARAGGDKLRQEKDGRALISHALAPVLESGVFIHIAGVCAGAPEVFEGVPNGLDYVLEAPPSGPFSASVAAALRHAEALDADAVALVLADMPMVRADTYRALGAAWTPDAIAVLPVHDGRDGNPLLAGRAAYGLRDHLSSDRGLRPLIVDHPALVRLPVNDRGVLLDIDTPDDLARWRAGTLSD